MAITDQTAHKTDGTFISLGNTASGYRLTGLKELNEIAVTGTSTQIDTTGYQGHNKTYAKGKNDPGTYSATANAALQHPIFDWLEEKQEAGTSHTLSVLIGNMNSDTGLTDGSATDVAEGIVVTVDNTAKTVTLLKNAATTAPGITRGDYLESYLHTVNNPTPVSCGKIAKVAQGTAGAWVFTTETAPTTGHTRVNVMRPPTLFQIQVIVMKVTYMPPADGIVEASIELQATGKGERIKGTPALGNDWAAVQTAYNLPDQF